MSVGWRLRLRDATSILLVLLALGLVAIFAWMTHAPEARFFDRLESWPLVGPGVARVRGPYLESSRGEPRGGMAAGSGFEIVVPTARETVAIGGGAVLRVAPRFDADRITTNRTLRRLPLLERRGEWVRVGLEGFESAPSAWLHLDEREEYEPILGSAPQPPGPLPDLAPDPQRLREALTLLGEAGARRRLGAYDVYAAELPAALRQPLETILVESEPIWAGRYGVTPIGEPAAALVVFADAESYRAFQDRSADLAGLTSSAHVAEGLVALQRGENPETALLHELSHLFARRAIGPLLPPWLGEGLAEEFADFGWAAARGIERGEWLSRFRRRDARRIELEGPLASLRLVLDAASAGHLPGLQQLVALDWDEFVRSERRALHYAQSGWFVHFLLEAQGGRHGDDFRRFLQAVAGGGTPDGEGLSAALATDWPTLEATFRAWLVAEGVRTGVRPVTTESDPQGGSVDEP